MFARALLLVTVATGLGCGSKDAGKDRVAPDEPGRKPPPVVVPVPVAAPFEIAAPTDKLVSVGRGPRHACVVRESGAVDCWGQHLACHGCDVPPPADATVRRVPGVADARSISADGECVLRKTGEVACLADDKLELVPLAGLTGVTYVDPGSKCFVHGGGRVTCRDPQTQVLVAVANVRDAVAVSSDGSMRCVVGKSGEVRCGALYDPTQLTRLHGIPPVKEFALAGDNYHRACFAALDGTVGCFDLPDYVEPGTQLRPLGPKEGNGTVLSEPARFASATQLTIRGGITIENAEISMEALVNGHVLTSDLRGSTGEVPLLTDAVQVTHGCAIRAQGSLVCWGNNHGGVLAQRTTIDALHAPPTPVAGSGDVVDLALGTLVGYALTRTGVVLRWGKPDQAWYASGETVATPMPLGLGPHDLVEITADEAGRLCMRSKSGEVWCQLEHERANDRRLDQLDTETIASISAGDGRVYAVHGDGRAEMHLTRLWDLATSEDVALGVPVIGSSGMRDEFRCWMRRDHTVGCPQPIKGVEAATALATGWEFSCVIQRGDVACWTFRWDDHGIRHEGAELLSVPGLHDATDLAAGGDYACAVHAGGKVSCFHFDAKGEKLLPPVVVVDGGAVDVELTYGTAGQIEASRQLHGPDPAGETGCAIMRDYTVSCWGTNLVGETGDGSLVGSPSPIGVKL
ncbi:MAG: hypothetical protein IPQ07_19780 [Myxococcales bacterium]|nr:hypothetical protein [Myxococcales bacterium]